MHEDSPPPPVVAPVWPPVVLLPLFVLGACGTDKAKPEAAPDTSAATTTQVPANCGAPATPDVHHVVYAKQPGQVAVYANPGDPAPMQSFADPRKTDSDPPLDVPLVFFVKDEPTTDNCKWINVIVADPSQRFDRLGQA